MAQAPTERPLQRQVFISYTNHDPGVGPFVHTLQDRLERAGFTVFVDTEYLHAGDVWARELECAGTSAFFVPVIGRSYVQRPWCMIELDLARDAAWLYTRQRNPIIIPVRYEIPLDTATIEEYWLQDEHRHIPAVLALVGRYNTPEGLAQWQARLGPGDQRAARFADNIEYVLTPLHNLRPGNGANRDQVLAGEVITAINSKRATYTYTVADAVDGGLWDGKANEGAHVHAPNPPMGFPAQAWLVFEDGTGNVFIWEYNDLEVCKTAANEPHFDTGIGIVARPNRVIFGVQGNNIVEVGSHGTWFVVELRHAIATCRNKGVQWLRQNYGPQQ